MSLKRKPSGELTFWAAHGTDMLLNTAAGLCYGVAVGGFIYAFSSITSKESSEADRLKSAATVQTMQANKADTVPAGNPAPAFSSPKP